MATDVTGVYREFAEMHRLSEADYRGMSAMVKIVNTPEESKELCRKTWPMIVISASGMASGGRVLHHLKQMAPDHCNTILFAGYQAGGTRGAQLMAGAANIKIHGEYVPVRAEVVNIESLSAHADYAEILDWLSAFTHPPKRVFLNHGEPGAADALRLKITETLGWQCEVPDYGDDMRL
jgi:metallo-beta-lactamase family protein